MGHSLDILSASKQVWLITYRLLSDPVQVFRYARYSTDLTFGDDDFDALPSIEIEFSKQQGGSKDNPATVTHLPALPITSMAFVASARVEVTIERAVPGVADSRQVIFFGWITSVARNVRNRDLVESKVSGIKNLIEKSLLGIQCNTTCTHVFGDSRCRFDLNTPGIRQSGVLTIEQGSKVRVAGLTPVANTPSPGSFHPKLFHRGTVTHNGLVLDVRDYTGDNLGGEQDETLILDEPPPPAWAGQTVLVTAGDDKTIETCRGRYANEENFGGSGYAMPDHNPNIEAGD